ncbi:MAG TPA: class I SAM-dependent methyltransferase [Candidatus Limnocylindrales bacterium]|nr:class I SAM-dependent methyltransferase [Candidatus Limnocylindrales bacterium]
MRYPTVGYRLPHRVSAPLFGDRAKFGLVVKPEDPSWQEWQRTYLDFYFSTQKQSVGKVVNDAGYTVMTRIDLTGKQVLEVGPGDINHIGSWRGTPARYVIADIQQAMLDFSSEKLTARGIPHEDRLLERADLGVLPFADREFDVVVSFYSLEHLYPLAPYVDGILRVLKPGGTLIGAIPAEGGLGWGLGRFLTTRRWFKRNTRIDPDKLICWEHPNFADHILGTLDGQMHRHYLGFWPLGIPSVDLNLVIKFVYAKR